MCGINAVGAQGCGCISTFYYAPLKIAVLLHKTANASHSFSGTVLYFLKKNGIFYLIFRFYFLQSFNNSLFGFSKLNVSIIFYIHFVHVDISKTPSLPNVDNCGHLTTPSPLLLSTCVVIVGTMKEEGGGGCQMSTIVHVWEGGGLWNVHVNKMYGGQKWSKSCPRGYWTPTNRTLFFRCIHASDYLHMRRLFLSYIT